MRFMDVVLLVFFINIGIGVVSSTAFPLFGGGNVQRAKTPQDVQTLENLKPTIDLPSLGPIDLGKISLPIYSNPGVVFTGLIMGGIVALIAGSIAGIPVLRLLPLAIFGAAFWAMWSNTASILQSPLIGIPGWLNIMITIIIGIMFLIAVIQFSSGQSTARFE